MHYSNSGFPIALLAVLAAAPLAGHAADSISSFRGPTGNGVTQSDLPESWGTEKNIAWSVEIPGGGWSSPVIAGERVFVTTAISDDGTRPMGWGRGVQSMGSFYQSKPPSSPMSFEVHCLELATGKTLWKKQVTTRIPKHKIHPSNSYATETPVTDGKHVYVFFGGIGTVACLTVDGEQVWTKELGDYKTGNDFGTGSSLALHENLLFAQCDNEEKSFLTAINAETGEEVWRDSQRSGTSWGSPVIWNNDVRTELVVCGRGQVKSFVPATGEVLWTLGGTGGGYSSTPTCDAKRIYFGQSGRASRGPLVAINAGASGTLSLDDEGSAGVAWATKNAAPGMASSVAVNGKVFVLSRSVFSCHDAETGKQLYRERLKDASSVTASLWAVGDKVFALNEGGQTSVMQVGDEFELLGTSELPGLFWSTPTAGENVLLIRSTDKLYCVSN